MGHLHTGNGEHDLTVSAYIVRTDLESPKVLLHIHKKLGLWLQFGGHVEITENPWQALQHEIEEESGYEFHQLTLVEPHNGPKLSGVEQHPIPIAFLTHDFPGIDHKHTDLSYAFTVTEPPNLSISEHESQQIREFNLDELRELSDKQIPPSVREIGIYVLSTLV